ncbi:diadenylate cyclase CdaA [Desulfatiglans anilini]|uniref:diadenylate cyclase CdaA n=1 Tax=Desulfatiglans anilini TaxID=90728 RepID=UPI0004157FC5|nr:diadenylate cyclase CdaA [Desulfatiglans anilini]
MQFFSIITNLRIQDVLDILFLTAVTYYLYRWFRSTKAFKALVGLMVLGVVYLVARSWGLFLTTWSFQILWQVFIVLLIILFQSEIRQVLERVNPLEAIGLRRLSAPENWIAAFVKAVFAMSARKIGALIIIERVDAVAEWITAGQPLDAEPTPELILSIFQKESPLHDGAVLIKDGRLNRVACYLPLSPDEGLPKEWGTRHRAALGLSERCDAWVIVVSEERGHVSLAQGGKMIRVEDEKQLAQWVIKALRPPSTADRSWPERLQNLVINRWQTKLGTLLVVSCLWLLLAGQQDFEVSLSVPIDLKSLPATVEIVEPVNPEIGITVRGLRKDASVLNKSNVKAELDLSLARPGKRAFLITRDRVYLPNDRVQVVRIEPSRIDFTFRAAPAPQPDEIRPAS